MSNILIHQTLHGYSDGHRLLSISNSISQEVANLLLVLSDISGPSSGYEFGSYLTGYPLEESLYAFARTWRASELPRPGCVWTHTLLIETEVLGRLQDPTVLLRRFQRPQSVPTEYYQRPLQIDDEVLCGDLPQGPLTNWNTVKWVLLELYGNPDAKSVVVLVENPTDYEDLVIAIWLQQWSRLRQGFSFCTLALERRTLRGAPFMLQLMPRRLATQRGNSHEALIDFKRRAETPPAEPWLDIATQDLFSPKKSGSLRFFLREFGQDVMGGRKAFKSLCQLYAALQPLFEQGEESPLQVVSDPERVIELVGESFVGPGDAAKLKLRLFGASLDREGRDGEADVLLGLARTRYYKAFDAVALRIRERGRRLAERFQNHAKRIASSLISGQTLTPLGRDCLLGILEGLDDRTRRELIGADAVALLSQSREVARSAYLWSAVADEARPELWKAVASVASEDQVFRSEVVTAILDAGADGLAEGVVSELGTDAIRIAMAWVERKGSFLPGRRVSEQWIRAMRRRRADLVSWLAEHPSANVESLSVIGAVLSPDDLEIRKVGMELWIDAARRASQLIPCPVQFMALVLGIGFRTTGSQGGELVAYTFEKVHDAAWDQLLNDDAWFLLEGDLPRIWEEWDRCERLRRGLVKRFSDQRWPVEYLLRAVTRERTFELVVEYCNGFRDGRRLIRDLADKADLLQATDEQKAILKRHGRSRVR